MSTSLANRKPRKLPILVALLLGGLSGLGLYTFNYAEGAAYFTDDPKACLNCHVMREQLRLAWQPFVRTVLA